MKKMFITVSFRGDENKAEVEKLCELVNASGWIDFCFVRDVEKYQKIYTDPKDLMKRAIDEIRKADALLIDLSDKSTSRAIEAGMAYALGKEVIVVCKAGTMVKDPVKGIAVKVIEYENIEDIVDELTSLS